MRRKRGDAAGKAPLRNRGRLGLGRLARREGLEVAGRKAGDFNRTKFVVDSVKIDARPDVAGVLHRPARKEAVFEEMGNRVRNIPS